MATDIPRAPQSEAGAQDGAAPSANSRRSGWRCLGLVAGGGAAPLAVAAACEAAGQSIFVVGLEGWAKPADFDRYPMVMVPLGSLGKMIDALKAAECDALVFAGMVGKPNFRELKMDMRGAMMVPRLISAAGRGDDALLRTIVGVFESEGLTVLGAEEAAPALAMPLGHVGRRAPEAEHASDLARALHIAQVSGAHDIGQGAVVCDGVVLAVEAQEGTDAMLARVADLPTSMRGTPEARRGVLVKAPKPIQDRRIDLPAIGVATVEGAARAGLAGVAAPVGGALLIDREAVVRAADALGLFVAGLPGEDPNALANEAGEPEDGG